MRPRRPWMPGDIERRLGLSTDAAGRPVLNYADAEIEPPSVANLGRGLTINGTTVQGALRYKGQDANSGDAKWYAEVGEDLSETGSGASPSYGQGVPLHGADEGVLFNAAKYFQAGNGTFADIATEDFVVELVLNWSTTDGVHVVSKRNGPGWRIYSSAGRFRLNFSDGTNVINLYSAAKAAAWYHAIAFVDRSGSAQWYINGTASGAAVDVSAATGSLAVSYPFTLGGVNGAGFDKRIAYSAMWKQSNWLDTHLQATIAAQRFRALTGMRPQLAAAGRDTAFVDLARNSNATLEKYNSTTGNVELYTVGQHWPRVDSWLVGSDVVMGVREELAGTNKALQSKTLGTAWTEVANNTSDDSYPGVGADLDGVVTADNSTDTQHGWQQDITLTAASWVISAEARKGAQDWLYLADDTVANCWAYFDLNNGVVGNKGAGCAALSMRDLGDRYRCEMTFTGTAAVHTISVYASDADDDAADPAYVGDASSVDVHVGQVQVALGTVASSHIITTTAAATRVKDEVQLDITGAGVGAQGAFVVDVVQVDADVPTDATLIDISDNGATNRVRLVQLAAGDAPQALIGATGSVTGTTDLADGDVHRVGIAWKPGRLELWVDGAMEGTVDTSFTVPATMDQAAVGMVYGSTEQPSVPTLLRRFKLYRRFPYDMARLTGGLV